jgi:predicted dehydrogenase
VEKMSKKIKWGVIGSGGIARRRTIPEGIIPASNAELSVVYDVNTIINKEVAGQFGVRAAESIDDLLISDVNAVYIATPANLHYEQVWACAKAKKHMLCEKPLGMTIEETNEMFSVCKKANVELGTAFMMRFQSQHQAALKMIRDGKIGKPVYARAQLSCWYPPMGSAWRQDPAKSGGGSLMDMGGHCIDLLEMFFGKIKQVSCFINNTIHCYKSEDSAVAMLYFENGAIGTVDTFFCVPDNSSKNVLELYGSKGSILAKGTIGQGEAGEMTAFLEETQIGYNAQQSRQQGDGIKIMPDSVNMYKAEIEEFSQAIIENRQPSNGSDIGIQSQKVLAACYESAKTGKTVNID